MIISHNINTFLLRLIVVINTIPNIDSTAPLVSPLTVSVWFNNLSHVPFPNTSYNSSFPPYPAQYPPPSLASFSFHLKMFITSPFM